MMLCGRLHGSPPQAEKHRRVFILPRFRLSKIPSPSHCAFARASMNSRPDEFQKQMVIDINLLPEDKVYKDIIQRGEL
jgi:hypothetical protein